MKISQETLNELIDLMQIQQDQDVQFSQGLSKLFGAEINPQDNSKLTIAIFKLLENAFNENQLNEIDFFCHDQDYGRKANATKEDLWIKILKNTEVVDPIFVNPKCNSCINNQCICNN